MNMFLHEIRALRKSVLIWTSAMSLYAVMFFATFPALTKDIEETKTLFEGFPEIVRNGMGLVLDNFSNILGFYAFPINFIILIGAIQAMILGMSMISKETKGKTSDFLLTKPVTRTQIITSKLLASLTAIAVTNILYTTIAFAMANSVKKDDFSSKIFIMISLSVVFVQLVFMALGLLISVIVKVKSVLPISLGVVFGFFFLNFLSTTASDDKLRYITPFKYFDANYIIKNQGYETVFVIISAVLVAIFVTSSYIIYSKRDIDAN